MLICPFALVKIRTSKLYTELDTDPDIEPIEDDIWLNEELTDPESVRTEPDTVVNDELTEPDSVRREPDTEPDSVLTDPDTDNIVVFTELDRDAVAVLTYAWVAPFPPVILIAPAISNIPVAGFQYK